MSNINFKKEVHHDDTSPPSYFGKGSETNVHDKAWFVESRKESRHQNLSLRITTDGGFLIFTFRD